MGLVRAAARVARGWRQDQVQAARAAGGGRAERARAPFAPQRLAAFRAEGHRLVLSTTTPVDMIAPFAEAIGFDDLIATALRDQGRPLHRPPLRGVRVGDGQAAAPCDEWADDHQASTWPTATPAATASSTCRCSRAWATPHAVNPDPVAARWWPRRGAGRSSTGTGRRASRASWGSSRTTCCGRSCASCAFPTRASTSPASRTCRPGPGPAGGEPPELLRRGRAGPRRAARSAGRCASSARRRSSTRPSWG